MAKAKSLPAEAPEIVSLTAIEPIRNGDGDIAPGEDFLSLLTDAETLLALGAARLTLPL